MFKILNLPTGKKLFYRGKEGGKLESTFTLFTGSPRTAGKSISGERYVSAYYKEGAKVIALNDKKKLLESAFFQFKPEAEYHHKNLAYHQMPEVGYWKSCKNCQEKLPYEEKVCLNCQKEFEGNEPKLPEIPVRINHPYTLDVPSHAQPETNYYTLPLKSTFKDEEIKFLLEKFEENMPFQVLKNAVEKLRKNEGLTLLLHYIYEASQRRSDSKEGIKIKNADPDNFGLPDRAIGDATKVDEITAILGNMFKRHLLLMPEDHPSNLDIKSMLRDTRTIDVFTSRYITDNGKVDDFLIFHLLNLIIRNKQYIPKRGLVLFIPEIENLCPDKPKGHKEFLVKKIYEFLQLMGISNVYVVADAQSIDKINSDVSGKFNEPLLGVTSSKDDFKTIGQIYKITKEVMLSLLRLRHAEFRTIGNQHIIYRFFPPPFMHNEQGVWYDDMFKKHFPERMQNYNHIPKEIKEHLKLETEKAMRKIGAENKETLEKEKEKREQRQEKEVQKALEEQEKKQQQEQKKVSIHELHKKIVELKKKQPQWGTTKMEKALMEEGYKTSKETIRKVLKVLQVKAENPLADITWIYLECDRHNLKFSQETIAEILKHVPT